MYAWIQGLFRSQGRPFCRRPLLAPPRPTFRPRLERLEKRIVPSTLTVTTTADSGAGSLRAAVAAANSGDTIVFAPRLAGQTIALTSGPIQMTKASVTIDGGNSGIEITGAGQQQLFTINANNGGNSDAINNLTLTGGFVAGSNGGAIVVSDGSNLTLSGDKIGGNTAAALNRVGGEGGAIADYGNLTVSKCTFGANSADPTSGYGGAIYSTKQLTISNSTLTQNNAVFGGAIYTTNTLTLTSDTLSSNTAGNSGGGVSAGASNPGTTQLTLTGCTLSGNTAVNGSGGGIDTSDVVNIATSTVSSNDAGSWGAGINYTPTSAGNSTLTLNQDTIAGNSADLGGGGV